jgi:hypothetical protein
MKEVAKTSSALPTRAVKGMLQFCRRAYPVVVPIRTEADLLPSPAPDHYPAMGVTNAKSARESPFF